MASLPDGSLNSVRVVGVKSGLQDLGGGWITIGTSVDAVAPSDAVAMTTNESGPVYSGSRSCRPFSSGGYQPGL
ncbi:MAG: hypothetical protein MUF35_10110 [Candidatus Nanopelagicales bacterium]|nr:hypothetical protein [Candidatus Nanopelagicales bacterium]